MPNNPQTTPKEDRDVLIGTLINAYDKRGSLLSMAKFALNRPETFDVITKADLVDAIDKELGEKAVTETTPIKQAAILRDNQVWTLPRPARHHNILWAMYDVDNGKTPDDRPAIIPARGEQGFITETGHFVGREEAFQMALKAGQMKFPPTDGMKIGSKLFSEDLW